MLVISKTVRESNFEQIVDPVGIIQTGNYGYECYFIFRILSTIAILVEDKYVSFQSD